MKRLFSLVLSMLILLSLCACQSTPVDQGGSTTTVTPPAPDHPLFEGGKTQFTVIRGEDADEDVKAAAVTLRKAFESASDVRFPISTDWLDDETADMSGTFEILVGTTTRPESVEALNGLKPGEAVYKVIGNKLVFCSNGDGALLSVIEHFIQVHLSSPLSSLHFSQIQPYLYSPNYTADYIGKAFTLNRNDSRYGGAQYIAKLFTEGLGRGPRPEEWKEYTDDIFRNRCEAETLAKLAFKLFSSDDFKALKLNDAEAAFAVYRAVLNRDPNRDEIASFDASSAAETAKQLAQSPAFKLMIPAMRGGSYGWGSNNLTGYTGGKVYTADDVMQMFKKKNVVELEQGSLVLCDKEITVPAGKTLTTEGNPDNYLKMARLIRTVKDDFVILFMKGDNATVKNLFIDGNRASLGVCGGQNVCVQGNNMLVEACKMVDTSGTTNMSTVCVFTGIRVRNNLITCYTSTNTENWCDGITHQGRGIVEGNVVIDATDVSIIVFRDWTGAPQDTIVRNNVAIAAGNSAFGAYHIDAWFEEKEMNFNGCVFYENQLWTAMNTHFNIALSAASSAWHFNSNESYGASFLNNYTPEGLFAVCGVAIGSDSMNDVTMRGNNLHVYIANLESGYFGTHLIIFNDKQYDGDIQGPYTDGPLHDSGTSYIAQRINTLSDSWQYREGLIKENFVKIPAAYINKT